MTTSLRAIACGFVFALVLAETAGAQSTAWSDADRDAVAYVFDKAAGTRTITLDLSDPKMARFLKRHYEISGMTADRYPGLHGLMDTSARVHAEQGVTGPKVTTLSEDLTYEDTATLMLALYPTAAQVYTGIAAASMEAAAQDSTRSLSIAYTSLCFFDSNNNPIGTCVTQQSFGAGQYFPLSNMVTTADENFSAALSATYSYPDPDDPSNTKYLSQMSVLGLNSVDAPWSQSIVHPLILNSQNNPLLAALVCTSRAVNVNANPGVCDYGTYADTDVLVSMKGSITFRADQAPKTDPSGRLVGTGSVTLLNPVVAKKFSLLGFRRLPQEHICNAINHAEQPCWRSASV